MNLFEDYINENDDEEVNVDIDESFDDEGMDIDEACKRVIEEDDDEDDEVDDDEDDEVDDDDVMESAVLDDGSYDVYSSVCEGKDCCDGEEMDIDFDSIDDLIDTEVQSTPVVVPDFVNILGADLTDFVIDPGDEDIDIKKDNDIDNILIDDEDDL